MAHAAKLLGICEKALWAKEEKVWAEIMYHFERNVFQISGTIFDIDT